MLPEVTSPPKIAPFQPLHVPGLSDIPWLGEALSQTALTWAAFAVAGLVALARRVSQGAPENPLVPFYLRETDAEVNFPHAAAHLSEALRKGVAR